MRALLKKVETSSQINIQDVTDAIDTAVSARDALIEYKASVDKWKPPFAFSSERPKVMELSRVYDEKRVAALSYRTIMNKVKVVVVAERSGGKRKERTCRDAYVALFKEEGTTVSDAIAKCNGDVLFNRTDKPSEGCYSVSYGSPLLTSAMLGDKSCFSHPRVILSLEDMADHADDITHWHKECDRRIKENATVCLQKHADGVAQIKSGTTTGGLCSIEPASEFIINDSHGLRKDWFEAPAVNRVPQVTSQVGVQRLAFRADPYRGHSRFVHVISGTVCVTVLTGQQVTDNPNLDEYLKKLPSTALSKNAVFVLSTGSSLWIPFGMMPVIIGTPTYSLSKKGMQDHREMKPVDRKNPEEYVSVAMTLIYDKSDGANQQAVAAAVGSYYAQSQCFIFKNIKQNQGVKDWVARLTPESVADVPDE